MPRMLPLCFAVALAATIGSVGLADDKAPAAVGPEVHNDLKFRFPEIKETRLSNGIRVVFVERHEVPLVSVHVMSTVGGEDAPTGVAALATRSVISSSYFSHWMNHHERFNLVGAQLGAWASFPWSVVTVRTLPTNLDEAISDLAEVLENQFPDSDIVREERDQTLDDLDDYKRNSAAILARRYIYPASHPFHAPIQGTTATVKKLDGGDLRAFWKKAFAGANLTITACGDVGFERLTKLLDRHFGSLPKGDAVAPSAPPAMATEARKQIHLVQRADATQARIAVATPGVPYNHPDYYALGMAAQILDSRLQGRIREQYGTTYGVNAVLEAERGSPPFWVYGAVENAGVSDALKEIMSAIEALRSQTLSERTVARARSVELNHRTRYFETSTQTADLLASTLALGRTLDELKQLPDRVSSVTRDQIVAVAQRYLDPSKFQIVVVGDEKELRPQLEKLGLGAIEVHR